MASKKIPQEARDLHNELVADLHDHINAKVDEHDFEKLLHRMKLKLPPMALLGCKNVMDVIDKLQKKGHVRPGEYGEFKKLIECIDLNWVDVVDDRAEKIIKIIEDANKPATTASPAEDSQSKFIHSFVKIVCDVLVLFPVEKQSNALLFSVLHAFVNTCIRKRKYVCQMHY
jgi:hypothetical protein